MQGKRYPKRFRRICMAAGFLFLFSVAAQAQEVRNAAFSDSSSPDPEAPAELRALSCDQGWAASVSASARIAAGGT